MNEFEVDSILARLGQEEFVPPPELVERTRRRLHRNLLLPALVAVSLGLQFVAFGAFQIYLLTAPTSAPVRVLAQFGLACIAIFSIVTILIARRQISAVLCRFEAVAGCR